MALLVGLDRYSGGGLFVGLDRGTDSPALPVLSSAAIPANGLTVVLTFDRPVDFGAGGNGGFVLASSTGQPVAGSYSSGAGGVALTYSLDRTVASGESVTVAYTQPGDGVESATLVDLETFAATSVTNNSTVTLTLPALSSATIDASGASLSLVFSAAVHFETGGNGGFSLSTGQSLTYVSGDGSTSLVYSISPPVEFNEAPGVNYLQPGDGFQGADGALVASLMGAAVTNNSTLDTSPPAFLSAALGTNGQSLTIMLDRDVTFGAGGDGGFLLSATGGTANLAYSSGSGTSSLTYAVDRAVVGTETLTLAYSQPGDGVRSSSLIDMASFTGEPVSNDSLVDDVPPVLLTATIGATGLSVSLVFDKATDQGAGGAAAGLSMLFSGGAVVPAYSSGGGTATLVYSLNRPVQFGETGTITYLQPGNGLENEYGYDVVSFGPFVVTNTSTLSPPTLTSATIGGSGASLVMLFSEAVDFGAGGNAGFTVSLSGGAATVTYSTGGGTDTLTYTLSRTVDKDETGTLSYTQPGDGVEDNDLDDLASLSARSIVNNSTQDLVDPLLGDARIRASGTELHLTFTEPVEFGAGGNGGFALTASGGAAGLTYLSGSGGNVLIYTIDRTVDRSETVTVDYTQPTAGVVDLAANELASFSGVGAPVVVPPVAGRTINRLLSRR